MAARDDVEGLYAVDLATAALTDPPSAVLVSVAGWDGALGDYWAEHDEIRLDADARGPAHLHVAPDPEGARAWLLRQTLADPDENHDWVIEARVDLDASDAAGEAVVLATGLRRL